MGSGWAPEVWEAVTSFCETVMLAKEVAKHEREWLATNLRPAVAVRDAQCVRRHAKISGHRRSGLMGSQQRVARRPIRTEAVSTARCVPRALQINIGPTAYWGRGIFSNETPRTPAT